MSGFPHDKFKPKVGEHVAAMQGEFQGSIGTVVHSDEIPLGHVVVQFQNFRGRRPVPFRWLRVIEEITDDDITDITDSEA